LVSSLLIYLTEAEDFAGEGGGDGNGDNYGGKAEKPAG